MRVLNRGIVGLAVFVVILLPLVLLSEASDNLNHHVLSEHYSKGRALPWLTAHVAGARLVGWWSLLTPLFVAIAVAFRMRRPPRTLDAFLLLAGAVLIGAGTIGALLPYFAALTYACCFEPDAPTTTELGVNIGLLLAATAWMAWCLLTSRPCTSKPR
jgi:hypothetical protein